MNACIVKPHYGGLFSNINKVLTCMRMYEKVHVDWSEGSLYGDCWNELFEPTQRPAYFDTITDYPFYDLTGKCAGILYQNEQWEWRKRFNPLWRKLRCKINPPPLLNNTVGVLVRDDRHAWEQLSGKSQTHEEYAKAINDSGCKEVFLMTGNNETVDWFKTRFSIFSPEITRTPKRSDYDYALQVPQTWADADQVLREVLALSQCKAMIHPISNMATCALIINPNTKSIYLQ